MVSLVRQWRSFASSRRIFPIAPRCLHGRAPIAMLEKKPLIMVLCLSPGGHLTRTWPCRGLKSCPVKDRVEPAHGFYDLHHRAHIQEVSRKLFQGIAPMMNHHIYIWLLHTVIIYMACWIYIHQMGFAWCYNCHKFPMVSMGFSLPTMASVMISQILHGYLGWIHLRCNFPAPRECAEPWPKVLGTSMAVS